MRAVTRGVRSVPAPPLFVPHDAAQQPQTTNAKAEAPRRHLHSLWPVTGGQETPFRRHGLGAPLARWLGPATAHRRPSPPVWPDFLFHDIMPCRRTGRNAFRTCTAHAAQGQERDVCTRAGLELGMCRPVSVDAYVRPHMEHEKEGAWRPTCSALLFCFLLVVRSDRRFATAPCSTVLGWNRRSETR